MLSRYKLPWFQQLHRGPTAAETNYHYEPLPSAGPGWIRLLKLKPGKECEELNCELEPCSFDLFPQYEALSYMWGDQTKSTTVRCNGKPLVIPASLGVALKRFRQRSKTRVMWADAICINQADLFERSQQVSLMSTIYTSAERVLAWIGLDDKGDAEFAFGRMSQINEWLESKWARSPPSYKDWERDTYKAPIFKPGHRLLQGNRVKSALKSFFERPYFVRARVQQEIGLAEEVDIFWGEWTISWAIIRRCVWYLDFVSRRHDKDSWSGSSIHPGLLLSTSKLFETKAQRDHSFGIFNRNPTLEETEVPTFSSILFCARYFQVGDPRDLVFSLLSHPAATRSDGTHIITADYTKSVYDIMWELTVALLADHDLAILSTVFHSDNSLRSASPSWVMHLSRFRNSSQLSKFEYDTYYCIGTRVKDIKAIVKIDETRSAITLRGLFLDAIEESAAPFGNPDFDSEAGSQQLIQRTLDFVQRDTNHHRYSDQNRILLSSLLLVAGKRDLERGNQQANFYTYCKEFSLGPAVSADLMNEALMMGERMIEYTERGKSREYKNQAWAACYRSKLFRTAKGYLGLGPDILKAGDIVAIIFGAKVPFILRPEGDHYLLVGDCYVHGIMQGEVVEEWVGANPEALVEVDFEVR